MTDNRLGEFIKTRRKQRGLTQQQLGEQIGASAAYVSMIEKGKKLWPQTYITAIADALEVSEHQLALEAGVISWQQGPRTKAEYAYTIGQSELAVRLQAGDDRIKMFVTEYMEASPRDQLLLYLTALKLALGGIDITPYFDEADDVLQMLRLRDPGDLKMVGLDLATLQHRKADRMNRDHIGSSLESFLEEEGISKDG